MATLGRDRAKRRYSLDMINFKCTIVEQLNRKMNGSHLYIDYIFVPMEESACGTCPIAAIWLPRATNFAFVFSLVSPAGFVGSEQD